MGSSSRPVLHSLAALAREVPSPAAAKELFKAATRSREDPHPPDRADALAEIVLRDHRGEKVRLGDTWREGPAALVFLRHYG